MRKEVIGNATLYLGDCREILPTLGPVDVVLTDPPYGLGRDGWDDSAARVDLRGWMTAWLALAPQAMFTFGAKPEHLRAVFDAAEDVAEIWRVMVWHKPFTLEACRANFKWHWEPVFYIGRLGTKPPSKPWVRPDVFTYLPVTARNHPESEGHNSQKPMGLFVDMIEKLDAPRVCDPFMGSGTTGACAVTMQRQFVGIEIEPRYFDIACRRIEDAQRQGRLIA